MHASLTCICLLLVFICRAQSPARYSVVISEIFADPNPSAGLPPGEFIELRNCLAFPVSLDLWRISDGQSAAVIPAGVVLQPDSSLVVCARAYEAAYRAFGRTLGLSGFPSLDNQGDVVMLYTKEGELMHAVQYEVNWYGNELKAEGGWSLEMIDHRFPCLGKSNWASSTDPSGGSPGSDNSVQGIARDPDPPRLLRTFAKDSITLIAVMDEPVDSLLAADANRYQVNPVIGVPVSARPLSPQFREVGLVLNSPMKAGTIYQLRAEGLADCQLNMMPFPQLANAAVPLAPDTKSLCLNELLFDPLPGGSDYVEVFNKGSTAIDVSSLFLGNRNTSGQPSSFKPCASAPWILFPGEYLVLTEDPENIHAQYPVRNPAQMLRMNSMPSLPDDGGTVLLADRQGMILDEFHYEDKYHFPLLAHREGVALERINPYAKTQDPANWQSAATDYRYGTPTSQNSQYVPADPVPGDIKVFPRIFSPDLDGHDDLLTIQYGFPSPGYMCSVVLYDYSAIPVRYLVQNQLCGISGLFHWNGLDEKNTPLPAGIYYVLVESFNLDGKRKTTRVPVVLAYKR